MDKEKLRKKSFVKKKKRLKICGRLSGPTKQPTNKNENIFKGS